MTRLREQIRTSLGPEAAFAYVADFANSMHWDPGTRFELDVRLGGRVASMEYRISVFEPSARVVLVGEGSGISAVDEIRFSPDGTGTLIDYTADIRLGGALRLVQPFLGRAFANVGRDALTGMQRTLDARAGAQNGQLGKDPT